MLEAGRVVAGSLAELRVRLRGLVERFLQGRRRGLVLALVSALRLRERNEPITPRSIAREAREILRRTRGRIDWGVGEEEFTEALAADLLHELVEMGVLEPDPSVLKELEKRYRFRSYEEEEDARLEAMRAVAPVLLRAV
jgi:hypothetical protein